MLLFVIGAFFEIIAISRHAFFDAQTVFFDAHVLFFDARTVFFDPHQVIMGLVVYDEF